MGTLKGPVLINVIIIMMMMMMIINNPSRAKHWVTAVAIREEV